MNSLHNEWWLLRRMFPYGARPMSEPTPGTRRFSQPEPTELVELTHDRHAFGIAMGSLAIAVIAIIGVVWWLSHRNISDVRVVTTAAPVTSSAISIVFAIRLLMRLSPWVLAFRYWFRPSVMPVHSMKCHYTWMARKSAGVALRPMVSCLINFHWACIA